MAGEEELIENTEIWKANGRAMDTNTGESPRYQSQSVETRNSHSEEVRGHWAPTGAEPMERLMDGWTTTIKHAHRPTYMYIRA